MNIGGGATNLLQRFWMRGGALLCWALLLLWTNPGHSVAQATLPVLACRLSASTVAMGGQVELFVEVRDVQNFYGYELSLLYDATRIEFVDADPTREAVNAQMGDFLSLDFLVLNDIYTPGEFLLNLSQIAPTPARSGSGLLARAVLVGRGAGAVSFTFADVFFYDANGEEMQVDIQGCSLQVGEGGAAPASTPTETATATALPTEAPATPTPVTPTATFTAQPTATTQPTAPSIPPARACGDDYSLQRRHSGAGRAPLVACDPQPGRCRRERLAGNSARGRDGRCVRNTVFYAHAARRRASSRTGADPDGDRYPNRPDEPGAGWPAI